MEGQEAGREHREGWEVAVGDFSASLSSERSVNVLMSPGCRGQGHMDWEHLDTRHVALCIDMLRYKIRTTDGKNEQAEHTSSA